MSFDHRFDHRWEKVIAPAIKRVKANDQALEPFRVDARKVSDSILTEILEGIARSRLVLADVTTLGTIDKTPIRNANVMYEVGIAHATRLPEEVLLFRSDNDALLFDTSNVRVNKYNPDDSPDVAQTTVATAILEASKEIELRRHLAVQRAADSLNMTAQMLLGQAQTIDGLPHPIMKNAGQILGNSTRVATIDRLLEMGALRTRFVSVTVEFLEKHGDSQDAELFRYECTEFGRAVFEEIARRQGLGTPEVQKFLESKRV